MLALLMDLNLLAAAQTCDIAEAVFSEADHSFQGKITGDLFEATAHRFVSLQHASILQHSRKSHGVLDGA